MAYSDYLVIGGGIIGMLTAKQLTAAGAAVTLLEGGRCGAQASWAGGGIVSPLYPWRQPDVISELAIASQRLYPDLVAELHAETGIDSEYRRRGLLYLAPKNSDRARDWARRFQQRLDPIDSDVVCDLEPALAQTGDEALWMPELGSIRNPRLCRALHRHLQQQPRVALHEHTRVAQLRLCADNTIEAATARGVFAAERAIVCAGAWSASLIAPFGIDLPIAPVKGQMLLFDTAAHPAAPLLDRVVLHRGRYLIPRGDGRILIGSTLEPDAGYDTTPNAAAAASLRDTAIAMLPALADCPVTHHWAGLRPGAPSGIPLIGAIPGIDNLFVNAGHYRNGIVLAPAATALLVDQLLGRTPSHDPTSFSLATAESTVAL